MKTTPAPAALAHVSELASNGIPAYQSRGIVVAVASLTPHRRRPRRWVVVLSAALTGQPLARIQEVTVPGATRAAALAVAQERAQAVAAKLGKGQTPGPARAAHLTLTPSPSPIVSEPATAYGADPAACDYITHLHIQEIGAGALEGFELEITGAGWDGEIEMVGPREFGLWILCNELSHSLLTITLEREAQAHREIVALLRARRQPKPAATAPTLRHAA